MDKNSGQFSMADAVRFANSPAGKQLIALLQNTNSDALQKAMAEAAKGNMQQAQQALQQVSLTEEMKKLLGQSGG